MATGEGYAEFHSKVAKEDMPKDAAGWAARWEGEFNYAKEWHRPWKAAGDAAINSYLAKNTSAVDPSYSDNRLNLFASNINTIQSMMYGHIPKVSVDRMWKDANDPVARLASEMVERLLNLDLMESCDDFSSVMRSVLQDRLLPGCGVARVRYDYESSSEKKEAITDDEGNERAPAVESEKVDDEWVDEVYVHWKDLLWSPARFWGEMRWISFCTYMGRKELVDRFGDIGREVPLNAKSPLEDQYDKTSDVWSKAEVWEVWDKEHRQVFWFVEGFAKVLEQQDDFLELDNFFPIPSFLIANTTTNEFKPTSDWQLARSLYREIDNLEERIALLTSAVKVVGIYDKKQQDVARLVNETAENKLIPVDNWAMFAEKGGIKGVVDFMPLEAIVNALQILQTQQASRIQQLFQITGMSDMVRGEEGGTQPASATEQSIKAKFASVRLQSIQDEFERFATDLQKLKFEIIARKFQPETIIAKSNILHSMDGPDPNDPAGQQSISQQIDAAVKLIKHPRVSHWRIQIKPESMAMTDYAQTQSIRTEYLKTLGFFMQSVEPFAQKFPQATPTIIRLLQWGLSGFKGSQEIEGVLDRGVAQLEKQLAIEARNPQPQKQDPATQVAQIKAQSAEKIASIDAQTEQTKAQTQVAVAQAQSDADERRANMQMSHDAAGGQRDAAVDAQGQKMQLLETFVKAIAQIIAAEKSAPTELAGDAVSSVKESEGALQ